MKYIKVEGINYNESDSHSVIINTHYIVAIEQAENCTIISLSNEHIVKVKESIEDVLCMIMDAEDKMI